MAEGRSICSPWRIACFACRTASGASEAMRSAAPSASGKLLQEALGAAELVHETPSVRFLRGKWAGRQNELLGASLADDAGQRLRAAAARHDPERHFRERKRRVPRRVGKIAVQDELQTARVGGTVDGGYHRDRTIAHRAKHALEHL